MTTLRWETNVLFHYPPHVPIAEQVTSGAARNWLSERRSPPHSPFRSHTGREGRGEVGG